MIQQSACGREVGVNIDLARQWTLRAADAGADVVLFPEMWNIGYRLPTPKEAASNGFRYRMAEARDRHLAAAARTAREAGVTIVATHLEVDGDRMSNAAAVLDRTGEVVSRHEKVHLAWFAGESVLHAGNGFSTARLELADGEHVHIGLMICYERVFPEAARALAAGGAELVLVPNASPLCENRLWQARTRAFENKFALAIANYPEAPYGGASIVCDGIAFDERGRPRDHTVLLADDRPGMHVVDLSLAALREYRAGQPWGLPVAAGTPAVSSSVEG
ncbi:MAG TPA: carbon-nitrogen hydrolase family protein [Amycolatopsis sp.]|uniref:carbon-nitrogen hydrolase family protein n=1 Tax=Amycolatopsis sp. TaxID=37632 RepID=UPI002B48494A|nr:carbon-nitrogen hydrolase family protein [Amycolatopsis sp.]HKS47434.1 carbon-nitrogen hydrolase family protein [Amycolatopsis sp.]